MQKKIERNYNHRKIYILFRLIYRKFSVLHVDPHFDVYIVEGTRGPAGVLGVGWNDIERLGIKRQVH